MTRLLHLALFTLVLTSLACQGRKADPLSPQEVAEVTKGQPLIFVENKGGLSFEGLEGLYLGQSEGEAMAVLEELCRVIEVFEGGWRHRNAVFKGCIIEEEGQVKTIRAGFWPHKDHQLSTLELKEKNFSPKLVRARFTALAGPLSQDMPRPGALIMVSERYRLFANWDAGRDGPTHLTMGLQP
jgi:hypothetical protein